MFIHSYRQKDIHSNSEVVIHSTSQHLQCDSGQQNTSVGLQPAQQDIKQSAADSGVAINPVVLEEYWPSPKGPGAVAILAVDLVSPCTI